MKPSDTLQKLLIVQANHERFNEAFYLSASNWLFFNDLDGMGSYFELHAAEEKTHFEAFKNYLIDNNAAMVMTEVKQPKVDFKNVVDIFEEAVKAEDLTSQLIRKLNEQAHKDKDYRAIAFIDTFEKEQQEEEDLWYYNLTRAKLAADDPAALLKFDDEMAQRKLAGKKRYSDK